ncbi:hypothetical protein A0J48_002505 [Sphaerospermopsis aphanizomenoides BCCUSP55]|uniref:hypothetical protein n=1 Tax=Sphaerospermopsis aphanizomenoides TaxID=459663 RepID=UPI000AEC24F7|nr:hypothetical protein [Sphaerospermopsis aphanizomenoides]MBK1986432.1 hypothetical protein [Sphaerospermopsis aphanizomenoides BCCUSP55]
MIKSQKRINSRIFTVPVITIAGLLTSILPSQAVIDSYRNDYRACAAQLLSVGVTAQEASKGCASALRPRELSTCVAKIKKQTQISPTDALYSCSQARRPEDLAACVVGISKSTKEENNQATLAYCGRSLLPVTFAQCVVGLRKEIDIAPIQAFDACIDASDRASNIGVGTTTPPGLMPRFETVPMPSTPGSTK